MSDETTAIKPTKCRSYQGVVIFVTLLVMGAMLSFEYFQVKKLQKTVVRVEVFQQAESLYTNQSIRGLGTALERMANGVATSYVNLSKRVGAESGTTGDVTRLTVARAQYLVNLANDQLQYAHNQTLALSLMQGAVTVLSSVQDASLAPLKQSLALNVAALNAAPSANLASLYTQLNALNANLNRLPLPATPLSEDEKAANDQLNLAGLPWWKAQWRRTMHTLGKVVIVRYNGGSAPPLVLPEERVFIYQNLHAQMENVFWAVLNRDAAVYQASLMRMVEWIAQYFDVSSPITQSMLQQLQALSTQPISYPNVKVNATLQLFTNYFNQYTNVKPA